jgi:hypothetical protein
LRYKSQKKAAMYIGKFGYIGTIGDIGTGSILDKNREIA